MFTLRVGRRFQASKGVGETTRSMVLEREGMRGACGSGLLLLFWWPRAGTVRGAKFGEESPPRLQRGGRRHGGANNLTRKEMQRSGEKTGCCALKGWGFPYYTALGGGGTRWKPCVRKRGALAEIPLWSLQWKGKGKNLSLEGVPSTRGQ